MQTMAPKNNSKLAQTYNNPKYINSKFTTTAITTYNPSSYNIQTQHTKHNPPKTQRKTKPDSNQPQMPLTNKITDTTRPHHTYMYRTNVKQSTAQAATALQINKTPQTKSHQSKTYHLNQTNSTKLITQATAN